MKSTNIHPWSIKDSHHHHYMESVEVGWAVAYHWAPASQLALIQAPCSLSFLDSSETIPGAPSIPLHAICTQVSAPSELPPFLSQDGTFLCLRNLGLVNKLVTILQQFPFLSRLNCFDLGLTRNSGMKLWIDVIFWLRSVVWKQELRRSCLWFMWWCMNYEEKNFLQNMVPTMPSKIGNVEKDVFVHAPQGNGMISSFLSLATCLWEHFTLCFSTRDNLQSVMILID